MINYENRVQCDGGFSESFNWEKFNFCDHLVGMIRHEKRRERANIVQGRFSENGEDFGKNNALNGK